MPRTFDRFRFLNDSDDEEARARVRLSSKDGQPSSDSPTVPTAVGRFSEHTLEDMGLPEDAEIGAVDFHIECDGFPFDLRYVVPEDPPGFVVRYVQVHLMPDPSGATRCRICTCCTDPTGDAMQGYHEPWEGLLPRP